MLNKIKIAVAGTGYVGMSLAALLARHNSVVAVDVVAEKVDMINRGLSPIADKEIEEFLAKGLLDLRATLDAKEAYRDARFVVIAVPTNYDEKTGYFDTHHIEDVARLVLSVNTEATMVIKSTIPIGYTASLRVQLSKSLGITPRIIFAPEFLREGHALWDNLFPSRIIVGYDHVDARLEEDAKLYASLVKEGSYATGSVPVLMMSTTEAEAVKLFANSYLAMRVAFFNELDSFAELHDLSAGNIIEGVCYDSRIGQGYNNPSFGYGGYCFPKDTKQLRADFAKTTSPQELIKAIVNSNVKRKQFIAERIMAAAGTDKCVIGFYRLAMKSGSDNFRESAVWDIMDMLYHRGYKIVIYEPSLNIYGDTYRDYELQSNLELFKKECRVIVANRMSRELESVGDKVYTRDVFNNN